MKILAENKKAFFDFEIIEKFEAGIVLLGQEVKSLKTRGVNLSGTYVVIKGGEAFWVGAVISPYQPKNIGGSFNPQRDRKLLLKKSELKYLIGKTKERGLTLVPLKVYDKKGLIKLEFGVGKRKKKKSKKEKIKEREIQREMEREIKEMLK
jgi:SsrA-binding protein